MSKTIRGMPVALLPSLLGAVVALAPTGAAGQRPDTTTHTMLAPVRVSVTRETSRSTLDLPFALSRLPIDSVRPGIRRASLTEMLLGVPGLVISNRHNPSQEPRLAVRGFGARSAFGIRGVRVVRDGVPLTLADGQTAVDFVDLETVGAAELMRGAAGALYGNASGGVVELKSTPLPSDGWRGRLRTTWNEDAQRYTASGATAIGALGVQGTITRNTSSGPRDYAKFRSTAFTGDAAWRGERSTLRAQLTVYDSPLGQNPGAVTALELQHAPFVADSQNIRKKALKVASQQVLSLMGDTRWGGGSASASVFGVMRDLQNPQAFAIVGFQRKAMGATARLQHGGLWKGHLWRLSLGSDLLGQDDDRRNFTNCAGLTGAQRPAATCPTASDSGSLTLHQLEKVNSAGLFARGEVTRDWLTLIGTVRGDRTGFEVRDRRTSGTGAGLTSSLDMGAVTPMFGVAVRPRRGFSLYANYASSFETPTTTELATQPDGSPGLNAQLEPQRGRTLEGGVKGVFASRLSIDASVFSIATTNELIPFEIPNSGGRRYFRNAGKTSRTGAELGLTAALSHVDLGGQVTAIDYEYEDYLVITTRLDGKKVPGVAPLSSALWASVRPRLGVFTIEMQQGGRTAADDANSVYAPGWVVWNARFGTGRIGRTGAEAWVGLDNVFDRIYAANIVTNATRGRYFETGAGRRVYVTVSVGAGGR